MDWRKRTTVAVSALLATTVALPSGAQASMVTGTFGGYLLDTFGVPPGFAGAPPGLHGWGTPMSGSVSYDPALATVIRSDTTPGLGGKVYSFTEGAALSISADGITLGVHATAADPLFIKVNWESLSVIGGAADATNTSRLMPYFDLIAYSSTPSPYAPDFALPTSGAPLGAYTDRYAAWTNEFEAQPMHEAVTFEVTSLTFNEVPEPATLALLAGGLLGLAALRRTPSGPSARKLGFE